MQEPLASPLIGEVVKWIGGIFVTIIGGLTMMVLKKTNNTYTKEETEKLIDLKLTPLNTNIQHLCHTVEKQIESAETLNSSIVELNTKLTETSVGLQNVKEDVGDIKRRRGAKVWDGF